MKNKKEKQVTIMILTNKLAVQGKQSIRSMLKFDTQFIILAGEYVSCLTQDSIFQSASLPRKSKNGSKLLRHFTIPGVIFNLRKTMMRFHYLFLHQGVKVLIFSLLFLQTWIMGAR